MNAPPRAPWLKVDGVMLLDKPTGISSNAALQRVKRALRAAKAGHSGTLDPLASGLLPLCLGEATKFAGILLDADKAYEAHVRLGVRTSTGDAEGAVLETRPVSVSATDLQVACERLTGEIDQIPPMYSALKVAGRPLYDYARAGVTLERSPRRIRIERFDVLGFEAHTARLAVICSKGTYIRVLAEDLGALLGCGAHLSALRRTRIGRFDIGDSIGIAQIETDPRNAIQELLPVDHLIADWPVVSLDERAAEGFVRGQAVSVVSAIRDGSVRVYRSGDRFLGAADLQGGRLRPQRLVREATAEAGQGKGSAAY